MTLPSKWLAMARELHSLAQAGLTYSKNEYDLERYHRLNELSAEIIANQSELDRETVLQSFSMQTGYATPKIDVRGAVIRDEKVLLIQEKADGRWAMPGGWADIGEIPSVMVEREVLEESGLQVRAVKILAIYDANRFEPLEFYHSYKLIFMCELLGGKLTPSLETLAADFFTPDELPPLSRSRTNERMLQEVFAHVENPTRQTSFD